MKRKFQQPLFRLAQAMSDGEPIDWGQERAAHPELASRLDMLHRIDGVASAFRGDLAPDLEARPPALGADSGTGSNGSLGRAPTVSLGSRDGADAEAPPRTVWGHLVILEKIGEGGFSEVYRAFDPQLDCEVALKLRRHDAAQDERTVQRFLDEARGLARVRHPNVLRVHGADVHDGRIGIWTDYVRGETLAQRVRDGGPYGPDETALVGLDLCCALAAVHREGLLHRDIKPSNVMREAGGKIILMDFGSVGEILAPRLGTSPAISGTPLTTAPEIFRGEAASPASDLYSLGVLLYWLVSGRYPVEAKDLLELRTKHERGERQPLVDARPDLPAGFAQVLERALHPDPQQRYASAGEMHTELARVLTVAPSRAVTPPSAPRLPLRGIRRRWLVLAPAALLVVVLAGRRLGPVLGPLSVEAQLYRQGSTRAEVLQDGAHLNPGEQLFLEIQTSKPSHVYVVSEDEAGIASRLYPIEAEPATRLAAATLHRLPGPIAGEDQYWTVSSAGGTETILVIAVRQRSVEIEKELAALPGLTVAQAPEASLEDLDRGIRRLEPRKDSHAGAGAVERLRRLLAQSAASGKNKNIWWRNIQLVNDGA